MRADVPTLTVNLRFGIGVLLWLSGPGSLLAQSYRLADGDFVVEIEVGARAELPRFDETAVVRAVSWRGGHYLVGPGLADEFGLEGHGALGFEEAAPGEGFLKIGVGELERDRAGGYRFQHAYPRRQSFPVEVIAGERELRVAQVSAEVRGYRYTYAKHYSVGGERTLTIDYELGNRGNRTFVFEHYNHNYFRLPESGGTHGCRIETGFPLSSPPEKWKLASPHAAQWTGERFVATGNLWRLPLNPPADAHEVTLTLADGRAVQVAGDSPVVRFAVWLERTAVCPELFSRFTLQPNETARWTRRYHFAAGSAERRQTP